METANVNDITEEIEIMIKKRLIRTEAWARENFEGEENLEELVHLSKMEVIEMIAEIFRREQQIALQPLGNPDN
jgi:hypothetical protein